MLFTPDTFMLALKAAFILALTETTLPFVYEALRGLHLKNRLAQHSSAWFRLIVITIKTSIVLVPLLSGASAYLVFPMALVIYFGLQVLADDYI